MSTNIRRYAGVFAAVVAVALAVGVYVNLLNRAVTDNMLLNIDEVAQHDVESIEASLDVVFDRLDALGNRLIAADDDTLDEVLGRLQVEVSASPTFEDVYLIDDQGHVYASSGLLASDVASVYDDFFPEGSARFVKRIEDSSGRTVDVQHEMLAYGVGLEGYAVGDVRFVAVFGICGMDEVRNQMRIESFDGRGYSSIVNREGYYIVNARRLMGMESYDNFFAALDGVVFDGGMSTDDVRAGIGERTSFTVSYRDAAGERLVLSFVPIGGTNWSFVMSVPEGVFKEHADALIGLTMAMLAAVVAVLTALAVLLVRSMKRSVEANARAEARTDFLSNMSHEIRTPLNGIIGLNQLMARHVDDRGQTARYVEKMGEAAQYLLALVNDILDTSKLQAGEVDLAHEPFSLAQMAESLCAMQREGIAARGIEFTCSVQADMLPVAGDEMRVKQVMMNILSNAAKFTPAGGRIDFAVSQDAPRDGVALTRLVVRDTGCGMSREFVKRIFDPFSQEHAKAERANKGTGLGMSISHMLVVRMGGEIAVESEVGKGSCFTVMLPLDVADGAYGLRGAERGTALACELAGDAGSERALGVDTGASSVGVGAPNAGVSDADAGVPGACGLRILVAEDNELNAEILTSLLAEEGFACERAADGAEALEMFSTSETGAIDVILMDVHMPHMDGYEAARAIRALDRADAASVHIVACSASTFAEDRQQAAESGMDDFVPKPIDITVLLEKLASYAVAR